MPYTTNQLITGAYYAAGVVSREFETISGSQNADGLSWLNEIISEKRVDNAMIPYETTYSFNAQISVEKYFIPGLIQIDTLTFFLDSVRYAMVYTKRNQYFGGPRVENITTLLYEWYFERQVGGGNLYIYFKPNKAYPIEIHGIFGLNNVALNQDLLANVTTYDLGVPKIYGDASLIQGQLVVNNFDLMGAYSNIGSLINYINSGIIPGVSASLVVNDFVLLSTTEPPVPIYVSTTGYPPNGTKFLNTVQAATTTDLVAFYNNGVNGIGATLTSLIPAVIIVDGYLPHDDNVDKILVINQTNTLENGWYSVTVNNGINPWVLTRFTGYNQPFQIAEGTLFNVQFGTVYGGESLVQTSNVSYVGISPITFIIFSALTFSNFSTIEQPLYEVVNSSGFDQFYITYLRYCLADRICAEYNYDTPVNVMRQLSKYESWINKKSRLLDLSTQKVSTLQRRNGTNSWAWINLSKGWGVPS